MRVRQEVEAKYSEEWQDLPQETKKELAGNLPGNHDVFGVIDPSGVILGGGYVILPSGTKCYVVIQWYRDGDLDNWDGWYWCNDIDSKEAMRLAYLWEKELEQDAKWAQEEAEWVSKTEGKEKRE